MSDAMETVTQVGESMLAEEDQARADLYGLLARLWFAAPDQALLDALSQSEESKSEAGQTALAHAWAMLARAAADADPDALALEYDALFIGAGSAEITLYCSHYLAESGRERLVVALRDKLVELGLGRTSESGEPEDHFAALLEVMRHLIVRGSNVPQITFQKEFFLSYISSAYAPLTDVVLANGGANFYQDVARLTRALLDVESQSFDMV
jgi:TorA maturation chaperone TorD